MNGIEFWFRTIDILVAVSLVLAIVALLELYLAFKQRYLSGSAVWIAGFLALAAVPFATFLMPATIPLLTIADTQPKVSAPIAKAPGLAEFERQRQHDVPDDYVASTSPVIPEPPSERAQSESAITPEAITSSAEAPARSSLQLPRILATLYLIGCTVFALRLAISLRGTFSLLRNSVEVECGRTSAQFQQLCSQLNCCRTRLLQNKDISVPVVAGVLRPAVIVPVSLIERAGESSTPHREELRTVLIHELTHVARRDPLKNLFIEILMAFYWVHPLAWYGRYRVNTLRERACDEFCVHQVGDSATYCETLIRAAERLTVSRQASLELAIVRKSSLGRRITAIKNSSGSKRYVANRSLRTASKLGLLLVAVLMATVTVFTFANTAASRDGSDNVAYFAGIVVDANGNPVEDAQLTAGAGSVWNPESIFRLNSSSNADGKFVVDYDYDTERGWVLFRHPEYGMELKGLPTPQIWNSRQNIVQLRPTLPTTIEVIDERGEKLAVESFFITSVSTIDYRTTMLPQPCDSEIFQHAVTNNRIDFDCLHGKLNYNIEVSTQDGRVQQFRIPSIESDELEQRKITVAFATTGTIEGRMAHPDGTPAVGVQVHARCMSQPVDTGEGIRRFSDSTVRTDQEGNFKIPDLCAGPYILAYASETGLRGQTDRFEVVAGETFQYAITTSEIAQLAGRFVDDSGSGIEGVEVMLFEGSPHVTRTDEDGTFKLNLRADGELVPNGGIFDYELHYKAPQGYVARSRQILAHPFSEEERAAQQLENAIVLNRASPLSGVVRNEGGVGVPFAKVLIAWVPENSYRYRNPQSVIAYCDANGFFEINKAPGDQPVHLYADDGDSCSNQWLSVNPGDARTELQIEVQQYETIELSGQLIDGDGDLVANATVIVDAGIMVPGATSPILMYRYLRVECDSNGEYVLPVRVPHYCCYSVHPIADGFSTRRSEYSPATSSTSGDGAHRIIRLHRKLPGTSAYERHQNAQNDNQPDG
ncbi:MAG: M56 family metallopeptidase [Planctomycetota bacterium]